MNRRLVCQLAFLPLVLPLAGCGRSEESYEPGFVNPRSRATAHRLSFAVHPLHNPVMLDRIFRPLTDYLTATLGARFKLVSSRDYASFDRRLAEGAFDFALPNPYQVVRSAGHVLDRAVLGSVEFAVTDLQVSLVLVLGHDDCRAVAAADEAARTGRRPAGARQFLIDQIALAMPTAGSVDYSLDKATRNHIHRTVATLRQADYLREALTARRIDVVGGIYRLESGHVEML